MAPRILIVDDDGLVRSVIVDEFSDAGYMVVEAHDAASAMVKLHESGKVSIMLTDVRMPGEKDGIDLALEVRALHQTMPIVILTGYAEDLGRRLESLELPFRYLKKPYRSSELQKTVAELLQESCIS